MPSGITPVKSTLEPLLRVMARIYAERHLSVDLVCTPEDLHFSGEAQDFQEMLGNVLDNASKWARSRILVHAVQTAGQLVITIDDDGPGLNRVQYENVLQRGIRADEKMPGSGLGLAIVKELAELYAGKLLLCPSPLGGLRVILSF
jgi:signal transduction histidine kinase